MNSKVMLFENERIDDLQYKDLKIIQNKDGFCFGLDAVLLANFAEVKNHDYVVDLGTGTGIIPILIAGKTKAKKVVGVEIQESVANMARRSVRLNMLESVVDIESADIKNCRDILGSSKFDVVVTNPPFMNKGGGIINEADTKAISRHEILCSLEDVIRTSGELLKEKGQFNMVHRPQRLVDIVFLMRKYNIEPKYLKFVHPSPHKKPNLILIRGLKGGKPELKMLDPLYVYNENGEYTGDINRIFDLGGVLTPPKS